MRALLLVLLLIAAAPALADDGPAGRLLALEHEPAPPPPALAEKLEGLVDLAARAATAAAPDPESQLAAMGAALRGAGIRVVRSAAGMGDALRDDRHDCMSLTLILLSAARRVGLELAPVIAPGHIYVRAGAVDWDAKENRRRLPAPRDGPWHRALDGDGLLAQMLLLRGTGRAHGGDRAGAAADFTAAAALDDQNPSPHNDLAWLYLSGPDPAGQALAARAEAASGADRGGGRASRALLACAEAELGPRAAAADQLRALGAEERDESFRLRWRRLADEVEAGAACAAVRPPAQAEGGP